LDPDASLLARFQAASGIALHSMNPAVMPAAALSLSVAAPRELLARPGLSRRTRNALERAIDLPARPWTVADLLRLRGLGLGGVVEVLETGRGSPAETLTDELRGLLAVRRPRGAVVAPLLERAIAVIASELPASEGELTARLEAAGLLAGPVPLAEIERAARFLASPTPFTVLRRPGLTVVVPRKAQRAMELGLRTTLRTLGARGVANVAEVCARLEVGAAAMFRRVLERHRSLQWLDQRLGWFWFTDPESPLRGALANLVAARGALPLAELEPELARLWPAQQLPPAHVLQEACRLQPGLRLEGPFVRAEVSQFKPLPS